MTRRRVAVVAGVIRDSTGNVLIAQRPAGVHMSGEWEFPGGKLADREERFPGLVRELREELGIEVEAARPLIRLEHAYADRVIDLDFWEVEKYRGRPAGLEDQALRWIAVERLPDQGILEADRPVITVLNVGAAVVDIGDRWRESEFDPVVIARVAAAAGARLVCFDADHEMAGRQRAIRGAAERHGLGAVACNRPTTRDGLRIRLAELPQRPDFRFALLDASVPSAADGPSRVEMLRAVIGALAVPVYVPGDWVEHDPARARELGAHGVMVSPA